jgi:vancomycin permeability regulator SanA
MNSRSVTRALLIAGAVAIAVVTILWSARPLVRDVSASTCVVLVLGYPTDADGSAHPAQWFRVRGGVRALDENDCETMILAGGSVSNQLVEADKMSEIASELGVPEDRIIVERTSRNTWENVGCSVEQLADYERIVLVSNRMHAWRAERYLCKQQPDLCSRIDTADAEIPATDVYWQIRVVTYEILAWARDIVVYSILGRDDAPACGEPDPDGAESDSQAALAAIQ